MNIYLNPKAAATRSKAIQYLLPAGSRAVARSPHQFVALRRTCRATYSSNGEHEEKEPSQYPKKNTEQPHKSPALATGDAMSGTAAWRYTAHHPADKPAVLGTGDGMAGPGADQLLVSNSNGSSDTNIDTSPTVTSDIKVEDIDNDGDIEVLLKEVEKKAGNGMQPF